MTSGTYKIGSFALGAALLAAACAGSKLNSVGDIEDRTQDTGGGGSGGRTSKGGRDGSPGGTALGPLPEIGGAFIQNETAGAAGAAEGGAPPDSLECEGCELVADASDVRDITTRQDDVYWVEYGSLDKLGNHRGDGRLVKVSATDGKPTALVSNLEGPIGVGLGQDYAYILVDQSSAAGGSKELLRVPLAGGDAEVIGALEADLGGISNRDYVYDWFHRYFATNAGVAYWVASDAIQKLDEKGAGPAEELFRAEAPLTELLGLTGDEAALYFMDREGMKSLPFAGGAPNQLLPFSSQDFLWPRYQNLSTDGGYIYATDGNGIRAHVVRMPTKGGAWKTIAESSAGRIRVDGPNYFHDPAVIYGDHSYGCSLVEADVGGALPAIKIAEAYSEEADYWPAWGIAPSWVYLAWDSHMYRAPRPR